MKQMKISLVLSTQPAAFSAVTYRGGLAENMNKIRQMGFHGVELAVRDAALLNVADVQGMLKENQLIVPAIGTGQLFGEEGLSLTHSDQKVRKQAILRLRQHIVLAGKFSAMVIIGLVRGNRIPENKSELVENWLIEGLKECATIDKAVRLVIEPINRYETDILNTVHQTLQLLEQIKMDNVGLLLDTFHMNIEESSLGESILNSRDRLFHFHIADSNRWYPGAGHINFNEIFRILDKIGYEGFISGEMLPLPDPDTSARRMIEFIRALTHKPDTFSSYSPDNKVSGD
jgi:sugar phosphate isomerase/epimerase